jgi:multisubunit Na+/H+ antiporter MnhE subunit
LADHVQQSIDLMFLFVLELLVHLTQAWGTVVLRVLHLARTGDSGIIEMQVGQ